jgi:hypothetical protein
MCRRELDHAESESKRNTAIIADYKQICSQLSERLEKQQTGHREELGRIKVLLSNCAFHLHIKLFHFQSQMEKCEECSKFMSTDGRIKIQPVANPTDIDPLLVEKDRLIRELELELAQTKLALVEAECKTQDLTHQLNSAVNEIQASKNTWFQKTLTSIKEATAKKPSEQKPELTRKESA